MTILSDHSICRILGFGPCPYYSHLKLIIGCDCFFAKQLAIRNELKSQGPSGETLKTLALCHSRHDTLKNPPSEMPHLQCKGKICATSPIRWWCFEISVKFLINMQNSIQSFNFERASFSSFNLPYAWITERLLLHWKV